MKINLISKVVVISLGMVFGLSCSENFLDEKPPGSYSEAALSNLKGVEGLLISTYAALDGSYFESWDNNFFNQVGGASNWVHGSIRGGEANKGTEFTDYVDLNTVERYESQPSNGVFYQKWSGCYDGIAHANETLRVLKTGVASGSIGDVDAKRIQGEARFLRGHFYFELIKTFGVPPYFDESLNPDDLKTVKNDKNIWPNIEADFQAAIDNLDVKMKNVGRVNKWAAKCMMAKAKVYQGKFSEALPILNEVIGGVANANGPAVATNSSGTPYQLLPKYGDNFRIGMETKTNSEMVFAYEASVFDGTFANGNYENTLNQPHGGSAKGAGCCGFFKPSFSFVNSFQTDASGLPLMLNNFPHSQVVFKNDQGVASGDPFTPDATTPVDPRLYHSVGRRGIAYLDWGAHPGASWMRDQGYSGCYSPKKNVPYAADLGSTAGVFDWGFAGTAKNVHIVRYADILLLAAECEAEVGSITNALAYVNAIRNRAKNTADFPDPTKANYKIGLYPAFADAKAAVDAVRYERMMELGMEGHRMYDLVRWDNLGGNSKSPFDIVDYMNAYLAQEVTHLSKYTGAAFTKKEKYEPIPLYVVQQGTVGGVKNIDQSKDWGGTRDLN